MMKLLIDADTGIDDSIAILFALKRRDVQVVGVTTGCGNTNAMQAAENTIRLIQLAETPYAVPVVVGANAPLVGEWGGPVPHIHGHNGIGDVDLPPSPQKPLEEDAADFIIRQAKEQAGELVLVTLGRMTNLALALQKEPRLPHMIKAVVAMGGTLRAPGNVSPVSEANIAGDPEAADQVLQAGFSLTIVGLDVTTKTRLSMQHIDLLRKYCKAENEKIVDYLQQALPLYMNFNRAQNYCMDNCPVHDPLAMLVAVEPCLVKTQRLRMRVECGGTWCRGMLVADLRERPFDAEFVNFSVEVDGIRAVDTLLAAFCRES
ncbi:MAG: nucleoside hydrolase [Pseudoflavonifractor sp.]